MGYQTIEVRKSTPSIGAEIFGADLSEPLGNQQFQEVHDALMDNLVIFFRDQRLDAEQHKALGRRFGKLHRHPAAPHRRQRGRRLIRIDRTVGFHTGNSSVSCLETQDYPEYWT